ncbi:MAG: hypothetical protein COB35_13490 [Gammaproteobacteria bacterium]|nr:MAG: hypothetical protein COB35_13490 [Gammaproteobacteria bacterium]
MKFIKLILLSSLISIKAFAGLILTNQYSIETIVTPLGGNQYTFLYNVTNNNQQSSTYTMTGLDAFYVMVPDNAILSNFITPLPYFNSSGFWTSTTSTQLSIFDTGNILPSGYQWVSWWGNWPASVYPIGTTASFGFTIDNVNLGTVTSVPDESPQNI